MNTALSISALLGAFVAAPQTAPTQDTTDAAAPLFAAPVPLMVGDAALGGKLPYPSPRLFDIDGDGTAELVLGDLRGRVHVSEKTAGDDLGAWGELKPFMSGERALKFHNW